MRQKIKALGRSLCKVKGLSHILRRGAVLGFCPICQKRTIFYKQGAWLRDQLRCARCYSVPRWRAVIHELETHFPKWREMRIHESSPGGPGSRKMARECRNYSPSQYFPDTPPGQTKDGVRCENLEAQTFPNECFDLVITQDVFEHILDPARAFAEVARTLKLGGAHVFTVPWYYWKDTVVRAARDGDGIRYREDPEYRGTPIDPNGGLVVTEWGRDLCDFVYRSSKLTTTAIRVQDRRRGIEGKFNEVFISEKPVRNGWKAIDHPLESQEERCGAFPASPASKHDRVKSGLLQELPSGVLGHRANGGIIRTEKELDLRRSDSQVADATRKVRLIAFYLPQFHPIPENDHWWGKGFTEWNNVVKAKPLFRGHYQPHLPADLGFYDLRVPEVREQQANLAREYGIHGFCYYHYWFGGRRLLARPFNEVLKTGQPDFPFCLCWANESWTAGWSGWDGQELMRQRYSAEDDLSHIRWLVKAFEDPRYIRIEGKPLFLIYRASNLPDANRTTAVFRGEAQRKNIGEIFLCRVESFETDWSDPTEMGFDAAVEFAPRWRDLGPAGGQGGIWEWVRAHHLTNRAHRDHFIYDYETVAERASQRAWPHFRYFRCVSPSFDNTPRRPTGGLVLHGATPELYQTWFERVLSQTMQQDLPNRVIFINAWNEWAEGNHLEPCQRWGRAYLEATQRAMQTASGVVSP